MRMPGCTRARLELDARASNSGSMRTVPVNQSPGPFVEACDPPLLISIRYSLLDLLSLCLLRGLKELHECVARLLQLSFKIQ